MPDRGLRDGLLPDRMPRFGIGISFGGSKIAVGIVAAEEPRLRSRTARIEWREHGMFDHARPWLSLLALIVEETVGLLEGAAVGFDQVSGVGVAWPGPGLYSKGVLQATFIPGCEGGVDVHSALRHAFAGRFGRRAEHLVVRSQLDAAARAGGEVRMRAGAFHRLPHGAGGVLLNIATGIAGAFVSDGETLHALGELGETYGQWGRYLVRDLSSGAWEWRPTGDGSLPALDVAREARFTQYCGGPALARRFRAASGDGRPDPSVERHLLEGITRSGYSGDRTCGAFVRQAGLEIGSAMRTLLDAIGRDRNVSILVLAGGIGEFFGRPAAGSAADDILLDGVRAALARPKIAVVRSGIGLDAELVGSVCIRT